MCRVQTLGCELYVEIKLNLLRWTKHETKPARAFLSFPLSSRRYAGFIWIPFSLLVFPPSFRFYEFLNKSDSLLDHTSVFCMVVSCNASRPSGYRPGLLHWSWSPAEKNPQVPASRSLCERSQRLGWEPFVMYTFMSSGTIGRHFQMISS